MGRKILFHPAPFDNTGARLAIPEGAIGEIASIFNEALSPSSTLPQELFSFAELAGKVSPELKEMVKTHDPEWIESVLREAESQLMSGLLYKEHHS